MFYSYSIELANHFEYFFMWRLAHILTLLDLDPILKLALIRKNHI